MSEKAPIPVKKEISANSRKAFKFRSTECLNCGHPLELTDRYCSYCSQMNTTKNLSLKDFFAEFIGSVFTYDSRLRYTVKDLLFKPGTITRNYVKGRRLKYANPFRFFLSVSIIYFIIQGIISTFSEGNNSMINWNNSNEAKAMTDSINRNIITFSENNSKKNRDRIRLADSILNSEDTLPDNRISKEVNKVQYLKESDYDTIDWGNRVVKRIVQYRTFYNTTEIKDPKSALDSLGHHNTAYNRWLYSKNNSMDRIKDDPFGFANYMMGKTPFFLFFFAPLFAFFFWLIYSKKKYTYMEHMIFIFHIFSFIFLALLIAIIPDTLIGDQLIGGILFMLIGPFYFYKALRNFYQQNRLITIIKFIFLNHVFWISAIFAALIFFGITAATY